MTTTTRNEAAERLRATFQKRTETGIHQSRWLDEALAAEGSHAIAVYRQSRHDGAETREACAAERRATVERIRERLQAIYKEVEADTDSGRWRDGGRFVIGGVGDVLDEEAARV